MSGQISHQKKSVRRSCFAALRNLSVRDKEEASRKICRQLADLEAYQSSVVVFSYLPLSSEPDLTPLFDDSKTWGFPRVLPDDSMEFRRMSDLSLSRESSFKIPEPDPDRCPLVEPGEAELILIPGVGFEKESGARLGRGKGHYDRFLEGVLEQAKPPLLVGVCFAVQLCEVPSEEHDITMDLIVFG